MEQVGDRLKFYTDSSEQVICPYTLIRVQKLERKSTDHRVKMFANDNLH
jgi:hypothetical protein